MKSFKSFEDFVNENYSQEINEAVYVPSNILDFAKRKGSYATSMVKKAATWAEKAGRRISGGTAIGKDYDTIILDMKHQGSEIYINLDKETIKLFGEEVKDAKSFAKVLSDAENTNESVLAQQEVNIENFPNPVTGILAKIFATKGEKDGEKTDDVVKTKPAGIPAMKLKPSQDAVYLGKALGMAIGGVEGGELGAIISKDNYILDGHHRWAATLFNNPKAVIKGFQADLGIGDLIPVLRALGDVFGNARRGEPKGGDINIFKASIKDAMACIESGANMDPKYYDKDKALAWLESIGGEKGLQKALAFIQSTPPPSDAPPRDQMPVIDAEKGEEKKAAQLMNQGKIDVRSPYANESEELNEAKNLHPINQSYVEQIDKWIDGLKTQLEAWPSANKGADKSKREGIKELKAERAKIVKSGLEEYPYEPNYPNISY